jgi:DNA-binding MarR family transcriptional regulator
MVLEQLANPIETPSPNGKDLREQAEAMAARLLAVSRQVFTLNNNPAAELPLAQLRVCASLLGGPRPMSALSRELGVSLSAMTQIADRLERTNLVKRVAQGIDRRVRCLQLTGRGKKLMRVGEDARLQRVSAVLENISPENRSEILASLDMLIHAAAAIKEKIPLVEEAE